MSEDQSAKEPTFTEDTVAGDFVDAIDFDVVQEIGQQSPLREYEWPETEDADEDGTWPFVVVRDGREFEVDIDVRVTELTPELKAKREADAKALLERLQRFEASKTRVGEEP
jgi:hypothetical protein